MAKEKAHPDDLRDQPADPSDDLETATAKSGSVDQRIPESGEVDRGTEMGDAATAAMLPQAGIGVPRPLDDLGPGEAVLEKEREHLRTPKRPG